MRLEFNNNKCIETSRTISLYRKQDDDKNNKVIGFDTVSTSGEVDVLTAGYVSGMKGEEYPYTFVQTDTGQDWEVELRVHQSTNEVWFVNKNGDRTNKINTGTIRISEPGTVYISPQVEIKISNM